MRSRNNAAERGLWGDSKAPDIEDVFSSCVGYANTPGWALIHESVVSVFGGFENVKTIELGCGLGKVSLLFSFLGARITLLDYSEKQLSAAGSVHKYFESKARFIKSDILQLPDVLRGQYDVAMSFGTAEHFWGVNRQTVFENHANVLKKGGLAIIWVPNKYAFLFHFGRAVRKLFRREVCLIDESPFDRKELNERAAAAGMTCIRIFGGELLSNDFRNFVVNPSKLFRMHPKRFRYSDSMHDREYILKCISDNSKKIRFWNDYLSYPLIFIGCRS